MMQRRGFLSAILAGAAAPAIVSASSLMKIVVPKPKTLIYKASGRYDINFDQWVQGADSTIYLRPSKIIAPASMREQCLAILNNEFDKAYAISTRRKI